MAYPHLQAFIDQLESAGELLRIRTYVDPILEIAEITDRISKSGNGGKALLFENTGYDFPVLMNAYGSERRMCMALGVTHLDDITSDIESLFKLLTSPRHGLLDKLSMLPKLGQFAGWMPKVKKGRGACQEVVMAEPDLGKLPIIQCWPQDGGRFITLPVIHTKDPGTGIRNVGMYRMQIFDGRLTGMHWHKHKVSARHFSEYKKLGIRMPVAVVLGGDPVYAYSATAPLPENVDEYMLAGFLRKKNVELVRCLTQPEIEVPADADFVIEGYVDPLEELIWEGPFGDHTGYYSLPDWYPRFHVTAITHRKNAVYPATIVGIPPQEDAWLGKATERIFLAPIKMTLVPEIVDMDMPVEGVFHNLVIARIQKDYPGQGQKVMNAMWGAGQMMFNKILVMTDGQTPLSDYTALARYVFDNCNVASDVVFSAGPMDVLDHSCSAMGFGGKMCIDGTAKGPEERDERYEWAVPLGGASAAVAGSSGGAAAGSSDAPLGGATPYADWLLGSFPEIRSVNETLVHLGIPCLLLSVEKTRPLHIRDLHARIASCPEAEGIKMILYVEHTVSAADLGVALWRFCNNLDPKRDQLLVERPVRGKPTKLFACLGLDGTIKTKSLDGFSRDWPNIIVAADDTIAVVDTKWAALEIGPLIPSPSLKFKGQLYGTAAVVDVV